MHSILPLKFGAEDAPISSKKLASLRYTFEKVELIVIDEISMFSSDMLYKLHKILCNIYISQDYFGGKAVLTVGDLMQLRPPQAYFIFQAPNSHKFKPLHSVDPLWQTFDAIHLTTNHRQGDGNKWTEMLNRLRVGNVTEEDREALETRRLRHFPDFNTDTALHAYYTNKEVADYNMIMLNKLDSPLFSIKANCKYPKGYKPKICEAGIIDKKNFMDVLDVKVGAKVMLISNLRTSDSLVNGAMGIVSKIIGDSNGVKAIIVSFDMPDAGFEHTKDNQHFMEKHGVKDGVPIFKVV